MSREIYDYMKGLYAQTSHQKSSTQSFLELLELLRDRFQFGESERGKKTCCHDSPDMRGSPATSADSGPVGH